MSGRDYEIFDVFTDRPLSGNPLAIVHDGAGLNTARMQAIAAEFNLSETVFVLPAGKDAHSAAIRIFTPGRELPFAGHPTVGTAIALAGRRQGTGDFNALVVLEEKVGPVRCAVRRKGGKSFAEFDLPRLPEQLGLDLDAARIAAALGLGPHEIGFENHAVSAWSAGVPYVCVPVHGLDAMARAAVMAQQWTEMDLLGDGIRIAPYLYCRDTIHAGSSFHARMFAPWDGIAEDPATGSAAAAIAGAIAHFDEPGTGLNAYVIEQGIEMGRPSFIHLEIDMRGGAIAGGRIGGHAVRVAAGRIEV